MFPPSYSYTGSSTLPSAEDSEVAMASSNLPQATKSYMAVASVVLSKPGSTDAAVGSIVAGVLVPIFLIAVVVGVFLLLVILHKLRKKKLLNRMQLDICAV